MNPKNDELKEKISIEIDYRDILDERSIDDFAYIKIKASEDLVRNNVYKNAVERITYEIKEGKLKLEDGETINGLAMDEVLAFEPEFDVNFVVSRELFFAEQDNVRAVYDKVAQVCTTHTLNVAILEDFENQPTTAPVNYSYTSDEFDKILEFYEYTKQKSQNKGDILFVDSETDSELCLGEVYYLNKKIDDIVQFIKKKEYTPYEAMIYIHNYVTSLKYTRGDASQIIVGALNGQEIVCSGYASIIKAIIDKLNMPGLKCDIVGLNKINEDKTGYADEGHSICLVQIKDSKYKIDDEYYDDAASDYKLYNNTVKDTGRFAFFLYPTSDLNLTISNGKRILYAECGSSNRREQVIEASPDCDFDKDIKKIEKEDKAILSKNKMVKAALRMKTKPIPIETLIRGLYNVIEKDPTIKDDYGFRTTAFTVKKILLNSLLVNLRCCMPEALNCLTQVWNDSGYFKAEDKEAVKADVKKSIIEEVDRISTELKYQKYNNQTNLR